MPFVETICIQTTVADRSDATRDVELSGLSAIHRLRPSRSWLKNFITFRTGDRSFDPAIPCGVMQRRLPSRLQISAIGKGHSP